MLGLMYLSDDLNGLHCCAGTLLRAFTAVMYLMSFCVVALKSKGSPGAKE